MDVPYGMEELTDPKELARIRNKFDAALARSMAGAVDEGEYTIQTIPIMKVFVEKKP